MRTLGEMRERGGLESGNGSHQLLLGEPKVENGGGRRSRREGPHSGDLVSQRLRRAPGRGEIGAARVKKGRKGESLGPRKGLARTYRSALDPNKIWTQSSTCKARSTSVRDCMIDRGFIFSRASKLQEGWGNAGMPV